MFINNHGGGGNLTKNVRKFFCPEGVSKIFVTFFWVGGYI